MSSWQQTAEVDYRKNLIAEKMVEGLGLWKPVPVTLFGDVGAKRITEDRSFVCIEKDHYNTFRSDQFLALANHLEKAGLIRSYHPRFGCGRTASLLNTLSRLNPYGRRYGQYEIGHGDKSIVWYLEFDTEERYFHEFYTIDFGRAMTYYETENFKIWQD